MQQLQLNKNSLQNKGFWQRQFQEEPTSAQKKFDWLFGVIMPAICFLFDPIVFKGNAMGVAILGKYKPFAYILTYLSLTAMAAFLIWGKKLNRLNGFLAGLFLIGGVISLGIGVILFPFSLVGLMLVVGILGFTPLLTAIVYLRNASRAFRWSFVHLSNKELVYAFALSLIFSLIIPAVINFEVKKAMDEIESGSAETVRTETRKLKYLAPIVNFDFLALKYYRSHDEQSSEKMRAIAEVYQEITGEDIETKTRVLMD